MFYLQTWIASAREIYRSPTGDFANALACGEIAVCIIRQGSLHAYRVEDLKPSERDGTYYAIPEKELDYLNRRLTYDSPASSDSYGPSTDIGPGWWCFESQ
jgi:hypothetical protein